MELLRTPDDRFRDLAGYPFEPHYAEVPTSGAGVPVRVHYLDEGPSAGPPVLLLHGEPSWSYLYRKMIPVLAAAGLRCIVPDLVGFGRSDKPADRADYSYARHVAWMSELVFGHLDLRDATFFGQDWGGLIGLRMVAAEPDRFSRIVAANTFLPTGDTTPSDAFLAWQKYSQETPVFHVGGIIKGGTVEPLGPEVVAAYDAPFPEEGYKAGARAFPVLVPTRPDDPASADNRDAWKVLEAWTKPFLTAFSDQDPVTRGGDRGFQSRVPGTNGQPHVTITGAGHFLQEDKGAELARVVADFVGRTS